ncbi:putative leucine-rich repeat receptor-like serine/threonine-protein kinase At2g24130 isoform X2 [Ricinus communis]|uniref:putative leucine-rich repeat receptor-like serine/threonine-protein kinase At2g24130 isoform X2 n=1 Tax=Ricinus communis TaxID=3988 RepID=UPI000D6A0324|nr:putative leucine-rich repeat receptor-like serine/threonine-protein kinase At2g24130 isoform X2 [Ricinus communis]|eukprot:XP_025012027.1 putative leucine-rich repeat receptor-like serine/threonine-protein kinase At2g24130 isoform X2 [Ricinus communis]
MKQDESRSRGSHKSYMSEHSQSNKTFIRIVFLLLLQHLISPSSSAVSGHHHHSLLTDKAALLEFRRTLVFDPNSKLANWIEAVDVCNFTGVACDKHHHRVIRLNLSSSELTGPLSPVISNLTGLRVLNLVENNFYGTIPCELFHLRHLRDLQLDNNNLHGSFPESLALLSNLTLITLGDNNLTGRIPKEIGDCPNLWTLGLYNNQFTGELPVSLTNISLYNLDVEYNHLSGELPVNIVGKLHKIGNLYLSFNNMVSHNQNTNLKPFFTALENCTELEELELAGMALGGSLPSSIGNLSKLLYSLMLNENRIHGSIPPDIANLSNLTVLNLTSNYLNGTIPAEISQLVFLQQIFLSRNMFTGAIPEALGQFPHLGLLDLSYNQFSGEIPRSLGYLTHMNSMFLNNNLLSGTIPPTLGKCIDLYKLDLSFNKLTGNIPPEISGMREIRIFLNLSHNQLDGPLPIELSKLENVQEIDVSSNNLTGNIFLQISSCIALRTINLSHNSLQGHLPDSLGDLKNLESLDVSGNQLSGMIPLSLSKIHSLTYLNLSFNNFEGLIPSGGIFNSLTSWSFLGNRRLCGAFSGILACSPTRHWFHSNKFLIIFIIVISVSAFLSTICCVTGIRWIKLLISSQDSLRIERTRKSTTPELIPHVPRITYRELSEATEGFDEHRLVGTGSIGHVYKGILPDGTPIAVKVLQFQSRNSTKTFNRECQVLKRIRHRNLIRIITACSLPDFKALVLPYMANGSLDNHLYPHSETGLDSGSSDLTLMQRVNICSDIAEGMAYLHHHSPVKVIHCDLKPSNVLLNDDMTALVSDFGIARLISTVGGGNAGLFENIGNSTANLLCGSIGYIAPEYGFGSNASTKGDVYSFGIVVLEMLTRKRPTDDMFVGGLDLHKWVRSHYHGRVEQVLDSSLVRASRDQSPEVKKTWEVAVGELIELGLLCTQESPSTRPTMLDAADDLDRLKRYLGGDTTATFASSLGISSSTAGDD